MAAVAVTRTELTAAQLRRAATRTQDANAARRMLALALVLDGSSPGEAAAKSCGMDRADLARLGAPLQRRRAGGPVEPTLPTVRPVRS